MISTLDRYKGFGACQLGDKNTRKIQKICCRKAEILEHLIDTILIGEVQLNQVSVTKDTRQEKVKTTIG